MGKANALSHRTGLDHGESDNKDIVLLKSEFFILNLVLENPEDELLTTIRKRKNNINNYVQLALDTKNKEWEEREDDVILWQGHIYVPKDKVLHGCIIRLHHDTQITGHPGQYKTIELVTSNYWWPGVSRDMKAYVKGCEKCQATKIHRTKPTGPLNPHDIPSEPWEVVGMDLIGRLPESGGYDTISVFSDHFLK